ncbi:MAG TPA: cytochrome c [Bryobacteraceae bacterium]|nr:cytochrome c [Bryobacteraceae bacterium]
MRSPGAAVVVTAVSLVFAQQTARSVGDGVYTEEQARRGEALGGKECASCHGAGLTGGEEAPALAGDAFLANWNGLTVGDLFDRIRKTMPQDNPGRLTRQQDADILAYMLALNRFPAGKTELPPQSEVLQQIKIETVKAK